MGRGLRSLRQVVRGRSDDEAYRLVGHCGEQVTRTTVVENHLGIWANNGGQRRRAATASRVGASPCIIRRGLAPARWTHQLNDDACHTLTLGSPASYYRAPCQKEPNRKHKGRRRP